MRYLIPLLALVAAPAQAACDWSNPGSNPLTVHPSSVLHHYRDIGAQERATTAAKMRALQPDDVVEIHRDKIISRSGRTYGAELRDMHWGAGRLCSGTVDRTKWAEGHVEVALVYFTRADALGVPTSCRNTVRLTPISQAERSVPESGGGGSGLRTPPLPGWGFTPTPAPAPVTWATLAAPPAVSAPTVTPIAWMPAPALPAVPMWVGPVTPVPEPAAWALWGLGLVGLAWARRPR